MKKLLISLSVLGWLGLMWVTSAFGQISCTGDGITVIDADTTWCSSVTGSTTLNNLLNNATARVAFHYADANRSFNLMPDPFRPLLD
ncbi:MAG: hypothetical protein HC875_27345, partial [Anaerolineales bacterium]|nr:hypothetical protein [Anaerolineales bacterium]